MSSHSITSEDHHHDSDSTDVFGFWLYILTDCILFGSLFAAFLVLNGPSAVGPKLKDFVHLPDVLKETFFLLFSNFTYCLAILSLYKSKIGRAQMWLLITFLFGAGFVGMELTEFVHMANEGFRWDVSGHISAFFGLVGTHGLHVSFGLLWILVMTIQLPLIKDSKVTMRRMTYLGLFWNFLDIVWIFVFTIVYLMGAL
ncbi:MAG: cytochrome o ubiquinol oxidase subunit III [Legionellales bacterium]